MELTQEHNTLIENIIRKDSRYSGNEDLFEDFCSETLKRAFNVISSIHDEKSLQVYLAKVARSSIIHVLKTSGRIKRTQEGYSQIKETKLPGYSLENGEITFDIEDPSPSFEEKIIRKEEIEEVRDAVKKADENDKDKRYFELFTYRYVKGLKQSEIASYLDISQGEVSKRLTELIKLISEHLS